MKYFPSLILFCSFLTCEVSGQSPVLKGKVSDATTNEPLPYASIFINGSTKGTMANESGEFSLTGLPENEFELICSFVGHETYKIASAKIHPDHLLEIKLKPVNLQEVEVSAPKDKQWEKLLKRFETLFLGPSKATQIKNPWVIDLTETDKNVLIASASAPIEIENLDLGYNVKYILTQFVASSQAYNIAGNVHFTPIETADPRLAAKWREARSKAFRQSVRHLLKSILKDNLAANGFELYEDRSRPAGVIQMRSFSRELTRSLVPYQTDGIVKQLSANEFLITVPVRMEVHQLRKTALKKYYHDINHSVSWIEVPDTVIKVTGEGVVLKPSNLIVSGDLSQPRVASLLPNDYLPDPPKIKKK